MCYWAVPASVSSEPTLGERAPATSPYYPPSLPNLAGSLALHLCLSSTEEFPSVSPGDLVATWRTARINLGTSLYLLECLYSPPIPTLPLIPVIYRKVVLYKLGGTMVLNLERTSASSGGLLKAQTPGHHCQGFWSVNLERV